ncbi:MAG: ubiquinone/menaquinone biosynthesis methyltransferase [Acidobacteria bacterium]|jgi:demethylmenaquinone methyltransferase/2-methoxy-6-polyprenyl-1,4-benzoquinol methylase|nr:ubiquinone/menaquinone biosynthesis methyltransferase [Acidobacteriota bacterium]
MFAGIAHRYDLLNHLLSLGTDIRWRRAAVRRWASRLPAGRPELLDLCCGTGDLARLMARFGPVTGCDFCLPMLARGRDKLRRRAHRGHAICLAAGDALELPFPDGCFDGLMVAFGVRNFADLDAGLREMRRVLRPGGVAGILEFSQPTLPVFRPLFLFYFHRVLPALGRLVSGRGGAYRYLPESVAAFPDTPTFAAQLEAAGFRDVVWRRYTCGVAALHTARR